MIFAHRVARPARAGSTAQHSSFCGASAGRGATRSAALWLRGEARMGLWEKRLVAGEDAADLEELLHEAHRDYTAAIAMSPASGWYWASLGALYHQVERLQRI